MVTPLFAVVSLLAYGLAATLVFTRLAGRWDGPRGWIVGLGLLGALSHAAVLWLDTARPGVSPFGFFDTLSMVLLATTLILLVICCWRRAESLGALLFPIAAICMLLGVATPVSPAHVELEPGLLLHILTSLMAYCILGLGAVQAVFFAVQESRLRHKHPGGFVRLLPPLQVTEHLMFDLLKLGFVMLSVALLTGFMFLDNLFAQHLVHKTVLSIVAWCIFGVFLLGHWRWGWRGRIAVRWTIGGFVLLMLAYLGTKLVLDLILNRV